MNREGNKKWLPTGGIVIKTADRDKLMCLFIEKHDTILGVHLNIISTEEKNNITDLI